MSTGSSPCACGRRKKHRDLMLPERLRGEMARPMGRVMQEGDLKKALKKGSRVYAVGDMVVATLERIGISPDIAVFDLRTQRGAVDGETRAAIERLPGEPVEAENPAGMLTAGLWAAIESAMKSGKKTKIMVRGEEDLASLACISLGDSGDYVIYGIPNEGISAIMIDEETKRKIDSMLDEMEPR